MNFRISTICSIGSIILLTSCNLGTSSVSTQQAISATAENVFAFDPLGISVGFNYPAAYQQGVASQLMPVYVPNAPYDIAYPQHASIVFTAYGGDTTSIDSPGIRVFVTSEVKAVSPNDVKKLEAVLGGQLDQRTDFPHLAGAGRLINAQAVLLPFQSGKGFRFLTLSKFDASALSDTKMTYLYQGISQDGQYLVSYITSVDAPFLADLATGQPFSSDSEATTYKNMVNDRLNKADPNQFVPSLATLDTLVSSIVITKK